MKVAHLFLLCVIIQSAAQSRVPNDKLYLVEVSTTNQKERTQVASAGVAIESVLSDSVSFIGTQSDIDRVKQIGLPIEVTALPKRRNFPATDSAFHDYKETLESLDGLAAKYPNLVKRISIGKSLEGRDLSGVRISSTTKSDSLPTAIFMGCHHAREHLSVEVPLMLADHLASNYARDSRIRELLDTREIWIVPMINPDGAEYDIAADDYQWWRKNRRPNGDGTFGVDLNRNYGPKGFFGGPGSSSLTSSDTYHGPTEFSEPETAAVRDFVRARKKATVLLTFHTFSELILWPYGHTESEIPSDMDKRTFEKMGNQMAKWNHYKPMKSSGLYLASGDTTDWAYEELGLFAFTFELSPSSLFEGGFYPGAAAIQPTFEANVEPALYMIEMAAHPFAALDEGPVDPLHILDKN